MAEILAWADAHFARTARWPRAKDGRIREAVDETWLAVEMALRAGGRGLPRGGSLPRLLAEHRGVRNPQRLPPFTVERILAWADAHHARTARWPEATSGPITDAPGETWLAVDSALRLGKRGLTGRSSLARLLAHDRGVRNLSALPPLSVGEILAWADDYLRRTGRFPTANSGPIARSKGETWRTVDKALRKGARKLPKTSLPRLLAGRRASGRIVYGRPLQRRTIVRWMKAHYLIHGKWPTTRSGDVAGVEGEKWITINADLRKGYRGLPGGESLRHIVQSLTKKPGGGAKGRKSADKR